jgi:hypothetical protein
VRNALVRLQPVQHIWVQLDLPVSLGFKLFEPSVLECLPAGQSFALVRLEETLDKVLALVADLLELCMFKVELTLADLAEDLRGCVALERQVARDKRVKQHA